VILRESHARDPDLQNLNVTVTEVRISPDLKSATAFIMPLGGENAPETVQAMNRAAAYFRARLAQAVKLRFAPSVNFALDTSFGYAERIDDLLRAPAVRRDLGEDSQN
jgi:ribosome-binding factor A